MSRGVPGAVKPASPKRLHPPEALKPLMFSDRSADCVDCAVAEVEAGRMDVIKLGAPVNTVEP